MSMKELFDAVSEINLKKVQEILASDSNLDINYTNKLGENILHLAVNALKAKQKINLDGMRSIEIINSSNPESIGRFNIQSLSGYIYFTLESEVYEVTNGARVLLRKSYPSASEDILRITELLIKKWPNDLNQPDYKGNTPLNLALSLEYLDMTKLLLNANATANLYSKDDDGRTVLHHIILLKDAEITDHFLKQYEGRDVNISDNQGHYPLFFLSDLEFYHKNILDFLIQNGANINHPNAFGITALHRSAKSGNFDMVKALLNNGANLFVIDHDGNNVFHDAASSSNPEMLEFLIQTGKNRGSNEELIESINATNQLSQSVILKAANSYNPEELLLILTQNGANINALHHNGQTDLYNMFTSWVIVNIEALEALLSVDADPNIPDSFGNYPIHLAAQKGNCKELCKLLILAGADINVIDTFTGDTFLNFIINNPSLTDADGDAYELSTFVQQIRPIVEDFKNTNSESLYNFALSFGERYLIYKQTLNNFHHSKHSLKKFLTQNLKQDGTYNFEKTPLCNDKEILNISYPLLKKEVEIFYGNSGTKFLHDLHNNMWRTIALAKNYNKYKDVFDNKGLINLILEYVGGDIKPHETPLRTLLDLNLKISFVNEAYNLWNSKSINNEEKFETKEGDPKYDTITVLGTELQHPDCYDI